MFDWVPRATPRAENWGTKTKKIIRLHPTHISPFYNMLRFVGGKCKTFKGLSLNKSSGKMPSPHLNLRKVSTNFSLIMCHCHGL